MKRRAGFSSRNPKQRSTTFRMHVYRTHSCAELRATGANQAEALRAARSTLSVQRGDIDQLRGALEVEDAASRRLFKSDSAIAKENRRLSADSPQCSENVRAHISPTSFDSP